MEPQAMAAVIGAGVSVGIAGSAIVNHLLGNGKKPEAEPNGWRAEMKTLIKQQIECTKELREQSADTGKVLGLIEHRLADHEERSSQAFRDLFELVRDIKNKE